MRSLCAVPERLAQALELMASDHRLSGDERAAVADAAVVGMPLPSAAVIGLFQSSWPWPRTAPAAFSTGFSRVTAFAVEALVRGLGPTVLEPLWPLLDAAARKTADREQLCMAAEVFAGVVRGTVAWPVSLLPFLP